MTQPTTLTPRKPTLAQIAWCSLIALTLIWDGILAPLHTSWAWLILKLLPLILPLRGILSGKIYTYQYCSMLILLYFTESIMRLLDNSPISRAFAAGELLLTLAFFVFCLRYLKQFKRPKKPS